VLKIHGEYYSFLALGAKKWVYASDTVSFDWECDASERYRNVLPETLVARDKNGEVVVRGHRGAKRWRTATTRAPVSPDKHGAEIGLLLFSVILAAVRVLTLRAGCASKLGHCSTQIRPPRFETRQYRQRQMSFRSNVRFGSTVSF
jgi:hypothetical protein